MSWRRRGNESLTDWCAVRLGKDTHGRADRQPSPFVKSRVANTVELAFWVNIEQAVIQQIHAYYRDVTLSEPCSD
jgi:hypothetical protein